MPLFEYTARNSANGQIQKGQVDVKTREEVSAYLPKNRMMLVSVREAPKKMTLGGGLGKARVKIRDIVIFTRQFATMINAGLPLVQSLNILASQTENKTLADVTKAVVYDVESGNTLADAFSKHPKAFSNLYVNMVAAGEAGGEHGGVVDGHVTARNVRSGRAVPTEADPVATERAGGHEGLGDGRDAGERPAGEPLGGVDDVSPDVTEGT